MRTSEHLALLQFHGADAAKFLQGYLTANTAKLTADRWQFCALCNLKGRVVATGWARTSDSGVDWAVHRSVADRVLSFLAPYLRLARSEAEKASGHVGFETSPQLQFELLENPDDHSTELLQYLYEQKTVLVDEHTSEKFLPQMIGLVDAGAIDFSKGCYLGQEVVARAQHRGEVKRKLAAVAPGAAGENPVVLETEAGLLVVERVV